MWLVSSLFFVVVFSRLPNKSQPCAFAKCFFFVYPFLSISREFVTGQVYCSHIVVANDLSSIDDDQVHVIAKRFIHLIASIVLHWMTESSDIVECWSSSQHSSSANLALDMFNINVNRWITINTCYVLSNFQVIFETVISQATLTSI